MLKYAYYPGCTQESGSKEYDVSMRLTCEKLGIELEELEDWNCCGAVHTSVADPLLAMTLPARNLAIAEQQGLTELVAPCSGCYKNFRTASLAIEADEELRERVNRALPDKQLEGDVTVKHPLYAIVNDYGLEQIEVARPLEGLKVACYYGCVLTRPRDEFDSAEQPQALDRLMERLGAEPVRFQYKAKCCGGAVLLSHTSVAVRLTSQVLANAKDAGADCVALACPMCHVALDTYQAQVEQELGRKLDLPVLYFTQLMALALGVERDRLGFNRHMVSPKRLLDRLGF
jgi:heterodisulfide reductase subunit B